jgi:regulatory protein
LPVTITKIEPQKKHRGRYSIYCDNQFIAGISQDTLLAFDLRPGKKISIQQIEDIKRSESEQKLRDHAFRFLSRRAHSCKELQDKLLAKGYPANSVNKLIDHFVDSGYLNDKDFARLLVEEEINLRKSGPLIIKNKLFKKGIDRDTSDDLLASLYPDELQVQNCRELLNKRFRQVSDENKKAIITFLRNKGFYWDQISDTLNLMVGEP